MDHRVVREIAFAEVPAIGTLYMLDGQRYEALRIETCRNRDGVLTQLIVWQSHCATCGEAFQIKTGLRTKGVNRRCDEHKAIGKPVSQARRRSRSKRVTKKLRGKTLPSSRLSNDGS